MALTRKHFVEIAEALHEARPMRTPSALAQAELVGWRDAVYAMCDYLAIQNPRFQRGTFLRAAGAEDQTND